jgi:hypothetical protein
MAEEKGSGRTGRGERVGANGSGRTGRGNNFLGDKGDTRQSKTVKGESCHNPEKAVRLKTGVPEQPMGLGMQSTASALK